MAAAGKIFYTSSKYIPDPYKMDNDRFFLGCSAPLQSFLIIGIAPSSETAIKT